MLQCLAYKRQIYPLHKSLGKKVFHKLPQMLLRYGIMEKSDFTIEDPKY